MKTCLGIKTFTKEILNLWEERFMFIILAAVVVMLQSALDLKYDPPTGLETMSSSFWKMGNGGNIVVLLPGQLRINNSLNSAGIKQSDFLSDCIYEILRNI